MTQQAQDQALSEIFANESVVQPSDAELMDMFETFIKTQPQGEEIPNLPRGFGQ